MKVACLIPKKNTSLRLGTYSLSETFDRIPSDTLFSGLINCISLLYGKRTVENFFEASSEGNFRLSSAFPGLIISAEGKVVKEWVFLPKPMIGFGKTEGEEVQKKFLKKINYLEVSLLNECLFSIEEKNGFLQTNYSLTDESIFPLFGKFAIKKSDFLNSIFISEIKREERRKEFLENLQKADFSPFADKAISKVTIDRLTNVSEIHTETNLFLIKRNFKLYGGKEISFESRFFFFFEVTGALERKLESALSLLIEEGIGGKRSHGSGVFKGVELTEIDVGSIKGKYSMNLSLLFLTESDLSSVISYELILRGGYITSGRGTQYFKTPVRMFKEGSVFKGVPKGFTPKVSSERVEIELGHPVYQYGYNFPIIFGG